METITSRQNPLMTHIRKLAGSAAYRRQTGECLCDSPKLLREAAQWGADVRTVVSVLPWDGPLPDHVRQVLVPPEVMSSISPAKTPQGVLFTCAIPVLPVPETLPGRRYVVLDGVQDPGNVGTLLRSAAAFGFDGVLLSDGCASVFAPKTLRASMGAAVRIPVIEAGKMPEAIALLREKGITCLAAALYQSQPLSAAASGYPDGVCVVIGSEGQGLTDETIAACTGTVRIPMTDRVESLNAGIAGSILLWHFREESL